MIGKSNIGDWIVPDWPVSTRVRALITTRKGGVSIGNYDSMNLGDHVGDDINHVIKNRQLLRDLLPSEPNWLKQVHGTNVVVASADFACPEADAVMTKQRAVVCSILTADCLPVLLCDESASVVAAAHAGWRGLSNGVIEQTVNAMQVAPSKIYAYLGPAIGPRAFEVGVEVRQVFIEKMGEEAKLAFTVHSRNKYMADLYLLAKQKLLKLGVDQIYGGEYCTYSDTQRFFSYRRDGITGRMAALIWLE